MSKERIVDIKTRRQRSESPSVWGLASQIISMEGIVETIAVIGDISHEVPEIQLFNDIPNAPEINQRIHDILWEAVANFIGTRNH